MVVFTKGMQSPQTARHFFITKLLYWFIVFYCAAAAVAISLFAVQYLAVVAIRQSLVFAILSIVVFFLFGAALVLSICVIVCFVFLRKTRKTFIGHAVKIAAWCVISAATAAAFFVSLVQAVLAQGSGAI